MPNKKWVTHSLKNLPRKEKEKKELIRFWTEFYNSLFQNHTDRQPNQTKSVQYKQEVFEILHNAKAKLPLKEEELRKIGRAHV